VDELFLNQQIDLKAALQQIADAVFVFLGAYRQEPVFWLQRNTQHDVPCRLIQQ
jgi:hypothetical protein